MRNSLVVGNWKVNGSLQSAVSLVKALLAEVELSGEVVICPSYVHLAEVGRQIAGTGIGLGAQNVDWHGQGAYTGEISADMLLDLACQYVIVGHSERRTVFSESIYQVALKFEACLDAGLKPILCLGETQVQRAAGETELVVEAQLASVLDKVGIERFAGAVIAYEPIWAIGTGETASPDQAESVHGFIRGVLSRESSDVAENIQILYGGSVTEKNATELFAMHNVDGALVGGASLKAEAFAAICRFAKDN